ncbi:serine/threonine protein kinase [candidate division KSB1 bacterium]|nr:MAG: serine/threonine protein kinase [candidate division KSB1 bacterium]MBC6947495.1 serine/threonine protein kinase [candidate division KSB1 bacterium]MCE7941791.1 serine/threonine protein kinase [Chlorobi bacterium CHB1]MDL1877159.1 serine/threonine protein kinase [Cytophagia bacterium CHB2]
MIIMTGTIIYDADGNEYQVSEFIGNGSFGNVYKITRQADNNVFALKTLQTPLGDNTELKAFLNEGNLAMSVSHQNVIKYLYFHDGSKYNQLPPYIIMEFASSGTLAKLVESKRKTNDHFGNEELAVYFFQLINGMEAINQHLVHRDIKPDNILISDGVLKITDFGLSKIVAQRTRTTTFKGVGCIPYLAPEGWRYEKNTIQMDIYSMGFVFYELATLRHPFESLSLFDLDDWKNAHLFQTPPKPQELNRQLSSIIAQVILKMINKSTAERFRNWDEVRNFLQKAEAPTTSNTPNIDLLLQKRLEKDHEIMRDRLENEKRQHEIMEFQKLVFYQYQKSIFEPLKEFVDEFNTKYDGRKIQITPSSYEIGSTVTLISGENIKILIKELVDENFYREGIVSDHGSQIPIKELKRPVYNNRLIMAWGEVRAENGRGFNLLLVNKDDDVYGEWFVTINTNSVISEKQRLPEPFAFRLYELEQELQFLNSRHIYRVSVHKLDQKYFVELIEEVN